MGQKTVVSVGGEPVRLGSCGPDKELICIIANLEEVEECNTPSVSLVQIGVGMATQRSRRYPGGGL
jgi:hypothetical protein